MGSNGICPRILKVLDNVITKPLSMIFQQSCCWRARGLSWREAGQLSWLSKKTRRKTLETTGLSLTFYFSAWWIYGEDYSVRYCRKLKDNGIIGHSQPVWGKEEGRKQVIAHWLPYTAEKTVAIHFLKYPWSIVNEISVTTYQVLDILGLPIILFIP